MVSKASEDLPDPETPLSTVSLPWGMVQLMFLRLWVRAPRITIASLASLATVTGRRHRKRRWTVALCAQTGSEHKRPFLIIGHHCMRQTVLPTCRRRVTALHSSLCDEWKQVSATVREACAFPELRMHTLRQRVQCCARARRQLREWQYWHWRVRCCSRTLCLQRSTAREVPTRRRPDTALRNCRHFHNPGKDRRTRGGSTPSLWKSSCHLPGHLWICIGITQATDPTISGQCIC